MIRFTKLTYILIAVTLLSNIVVGADEPSSCKMTKSREILFSSETAMDKLTVTISDKPCKQAILNISVTNAKGVILYDYEAPFSQHVVTHWEDPQPYKDAIHFVNNTLESANWGQSLNLPVWKDEDQFYDENSTSVAVEKTKYKLYREMNLPVFYHLTYYEGWRHIVFDKKKKASVILSDGGL